MSADVKKTKSPWYSTPNSKRTRKERKFTLSDDESEHLDALAFEREMPASRVLGEIILATPLRGES